MFGIGAPELIVILVVALVVLGPKRLPELARGLGRTLGEFRRATSGVSEELDNARIMLEEEVRQAEHSARVNDPATAEPRIAAPAQASDAQPQQDPTPQPHKVDDDDHQTKKRSSSTLKEKSAQ